MAGGDAKMRRKTNKMSAVIRSVNHTGPLDGLQSSNLPWFNGFTTITVTANLLIKYYLIVFMK